MGKTLILTEKPSVAKEYADILGVKGAGYGFIENERYVITWCVGHLVRMAYPQKYDEKWEKWNLDDLPFLPEKYMYEVIPEVKAQYKVVHEQMHRKDIDVMLYCGDSGREGEVIGRLIRNYGGIRAGIEERRVWIDSCTSEEILRGIKQAKSLKEYDRIADAGIMRGIEDYAMGINFSRVLSCKYGQIFNRMIQSDKRKTIAVGRVMTCVLGMVVTRERQIRNFVETPFYRVLGNFDGIEAEWKVDEGSGFFQSEKLYKECGFKMKADADGLVKTLTGEPSVIESVNYKESNKNAPLLFNLAELQAECSKQFKLTPNKTLEIAQELYEKKMTTYPRTDARVLSSAVAKEIKKNIEGLATISEMKEYVADVLSGEKYKKLAETSYMDDSKITDHYAIIPTGQNTREELTPIQAQVYALIVRRFLAIFFPSAVYLNCQVVIKVGSEKFYASCRQIKSKGYLAVMKGEEEKEKASALLDTIMECQKGSRVKNMVLNVAEGKTMPPKRYDAGSMILTMENAGKLIEDATLREQIKGSGIGTSATRAEIIDKLVRIGYIVLNPKTLILTPHRDGEVVYDIVEQTLPDFLSPKMTANWETKLSMIADGQLDATEHKRELEGYIRNKVEEIKRGSITISETEGVSNAAMRNKRNEAIGICPVCHKDVYETQRAFSCVDRECGFSLWKNDYFFEKKKKSLTKSMAKSLLSKGKVLCKGFYSESKKKTYEAVVVLKVENGKAKYSLEFLK